METVKVFMHLQQIMPDPRPFKPSSPILTTTGIQVAIPIPFETKYIDNYDWLIAHPEQLEPILSLAGLAYLCEQCEIAMSQVNKQEPESGEAWEETTTSEDNTVSGEKVADDGWGATFDTNDAGKADEELWEGNEEDWS
jgi:hypothetical protein